jgi:ribosomal protein S18 acetylase RimI-like enzyme
MDIKGKIVTRRFQETDFPNYESWFVDPELNRQLGPTDREWLTCVLTDSEGAEYSFLINQELIAVAGVHYPTAEHNYYYITDIAVRPQLRGRGIGERIVRELQVQTELQLVKNWRAGVAINNIAAAKLLESLGWRKIFQANDSDDLTVYEIVVQ